MGPLSQHPDAATSETLQDTRFFWEARAISPQPAGKVFNKSRSHQRERSDVHAMLSTLVAIAAFAPPAARTSPHAARSVDQPLRAAQPLCKVWDPDDKVIYVGVPSR